MLNTPTIPHSEETEQLQELLLSRLTILAATYRGVSTQDRPQVIQEYHHTMQVLYDIGWDEIIDFEAGLPHTDMPESYQQKHSNPSNAAWLMLSDK